MSDTQPSHKLASDKPDLASQKPVSAYCFLSNNCLQCIPINEFNSIADSLLHLGDSSAVNDDASYTPDKLYLKNRNLIYRLNDPSVSDSELEPSSLSTHVVSSSPPSASKLSLPHAPSPLRRSPSPCPSNEELQVSLIIVNYSTHAIYSPKLIINTIEDMEQGYPELRNLLSKVIPGWTDFSRMEFKKLTGGITNMLLRARYGDSDVLIRAYGHGTNLIIDRHREFISHLMLNSIGLAPPIFSRFKNGLVYGYLPGRSLEPQELSDPAIFPLVAQQLGYLHESLDYKLIEKGVETVREYLRGLKPHKNSKRHKPKTSFISNIWDLIEDWIDVVPVNKSLIASFADHSPDETVSEELLKDIIKKEFFWLKQQLVNANSPTVAAHCDLLSGNIIIPEERGPIRDDALPDRASNQIQFIDYEYMMPAPRAFDIANHLAEWQGFLCDRSAIPDPSPNNPLLVKWVKAYLNNEDATESQVSDLILEIATFYGLPGFYWGIWAMIQSELSNIDFDYAEYGQKRLEEYWDWKRIFSKAT